MVFYEYSPYLFAGLCILLLTIFACSMDHFFYYERSTLLVYIFCLLVHAYTVATFFLPSLFTYFISLLSLVSLLLIALFLVLTLLDWSSSREGQMVSKVYQLQAAIDDCEEELTEQKEEPSDSQLLQFVRNTHHAQVFLPLQHH